MSTPARPDSIAQLEALIGALKAKGIVSEADLAARQAQTDKASPETGARMVARAWTDPAYRALLLRDGTAAAEAMGISMAGAPPLGVLEDTAPRHHVIVCTLCSCYPRAVLGYPPYWYKSFAYRARVVREPRVVLAEWGTTLPDSVEVRVVDSTADYRWMVLPLRPAGTEGWSQEQLMALVTRDVLVGVALPVPPLAAAAE
ncbi:MAG: nitrile hydratase subunit alpha [Acetobacteraceae bacterium]|nr:nitrile hydratase subunit alpha [Acetobacteraceae bacterium]